jgi:CheY-like chemotaxis protein
MAQARIAVIDDDHSQVQVLKELLEDEGYHVTTHANVLDAVAFINQEQPALVLLDLVQGHRLVGLEVVRELKRSAQTRDLPVIVISADAFALRDHAAELNIRGVTALAKPYSFDMLLSLIHESLQPRHECDPAARR